MDKLMYYEKCYEIISSYINDLENNVDDHYRGISYSIAVKYLFLNSSNDKDVSIREEILLIVDTPRYVDIRDVLSYIKNGNPFLKKNDGFVAYSMKTYTYDEFLDALKCLKKCLEKACSLVKND